MADRQIRLLYPPNMVDEPVLYQLVQKFDLITNVRKADVNAQGGWLELELRGEEPVIAAALDWVRGLGLRVEENKQ